MRNDESRRKIICTLAESSRFTGIYDPVRAICKTFLKIDEACLNRKW